VTTSKEATGAVSQRAAVNVVVRGAAEVTGKVATLAWTVVAARMLSQESFGAVSYALTVMLVASSLPTGGFDAGLIRRGSADPAGLSRYYTENLVWKTALGIPAFLVAAVLTWSGDTVGAAIVMGAFLLSGLPELWSSAARSASAARQRPTRTSWALVLQRVATAAAIIGALLLDMGAVGVAVGFLIGTVIGWVAHVYAVRELDVRLTLPSIRRGDLWDLLAETWVIAICSVVLMLLMRVDAVILEALAGYEAVADYSAAYRLLETVLFVTFAINHAIFPVMSADTSTERIRRGFERGVSVAAFVYMPFAAVCLTEGKEIIALAFGDEYAQTSPEILSWLVPAPILYAIAFFGAAVLLSRKRPMGMLVGASTATLANVVLNFWLIPHYVGVGAAIATSVSYGVYALAVYLALRRHVIKVNILRPLLESTVAALVLGVVLQLLHLPLFLELAVGGVLYTGLWWALAARFAPEQIEVVQRLLRREGSR
jgi:O-antigen/teichoic acid export membrane protein